MMHALLHLAKCLSQRERFLSGALEDVVGEPLGALGTDAWQTSEGFDQAVEGFETT